MPRSPRGVGWAGPVEETTIKKLYLAIASNNICYFWVMMQSYYIAIHLTMTCPIHF